ncbi:MULTISPECIES: ATP-binding protein [Dethiosulfovibrio]|jgi:AAA15 family ATPase/GTPase|uniref:AAA family ATPase n=2 Tax=Dethiosulfovibrio TaxID=47054 RepID=A0ABS9EQU3_9BACT|nr:MULTISPECIES: ATP-binding protein [Dethiosulfovibrio]MCF4113201.1 AAA family ATPase [Dethiosulfovibrio russensis]MCF4142265.1 AAA family ATPase [Dethiosulfovibrio marinus]MCF4144573.1 AAA family ATPase [Dethiosulfovibrio acidaminovorans]
MIEKVDLNNFGPLKHLHWPDLGKINLVIGENGRGKTFLLKALYSAIRSIEMSGRGDDRQSSLADLLARKLHWTFQAEKIGDLVTKGSDEKLRMRAIIDGDELEYSFGKDTTKQITKIGWEGSFRKNNSIFIPAKELLSIHHVVLRSREVDQVFGFDDTYFDLAKVLSIKPTRGKNFTEFAQSRENLKGILGGRVEYDDEAQRWSFKVGNEKFAIGTTAEGIKKIAILDILLGNRYLSPGSVVFIDEVEAAMHPKAISDFLDILAVLADRGIQFFLATHSYFVLKKTLLMSRKKRMSIPVMSISESGCSSANLIDGMPDNPIVDESIRLYQEQVEMSLS